MEYVTQEQIDTLNEVAKRHDKDTMCALFAIAVLAEHVLMVKYIAANYMHMFNDEQQRVAKKLITRIAEVEQFESAAAELATATIQKAMMH